LSNSSNVNPASGGQPQPAQPAPPPAPVPNQQQDNPALPTTREVSGALSKLDALKQNLPGPKTMPSGPTPQASPIGADRTGGGVAKIRSPFATNTVTNPTRPAPDIALTPDQIRTHEADARTPLGVRSQRKANAKTAFDSDDRTAPDADLELRHPTAADQHLAPFFPQTQGAAGTGAAFEQDRASLLRNIREAIPEPQRGQPPLVKARYLGHALAEATGGDVARASAALDLLKSPRGQTMQASAQQKRDAFAVRCAMARSRASFNALRDVEPGATPPNLSEYETKVHENADWQSWRAADTLLSAWPAQHERPASPDALAAAVNAMLPPAERAANVPVAQAPHQDEISSALADHAQAAKAFLCGRALVENPNAQPATPLRAAYFAHRNGIAESDVGKVQTRLFSIVTHAQRNAATAARTGSWFKQTREALKYNRKKTDIDAVHDPYNPHAALALGTAGGLMGHPVDDYSTLDSIGVVIDKLNADVVGATPRVPGDAPTAEELQGAVRAAALRQWTATLGVKGWLRDDTKFGRWQRNQIAEDAAKALNIDKNAVKSSDAFRNLPKLMNVAALETWAQDAQVPMNTPVGGAHTLADNLRRMRELRQDGLPLPATPEDNIEPLCNLIDATPRTYTVQMSSGGVFGLDANISANLAKTLGWVGLPSASVAPDVRRLKGRHAVFELGSSSHHGEMFIGTDERRSRHYGVGGFVGWYLAGGKVLASGYASAIGGRDTSSARGVVIRTPFDQTGGQPGDDTAWRDKMKEVARTACLSGSAPGAGLRSTKEEMWNGLADQYFCDPDLSIGWIENQNSTRYGSVAATAAGRYVLPKNNKTGLFATAEGVVSQSQGHATDASGSRTVDKSSHAQRAAFNRSWALVGSPTPIGSVHHHPLKVGPFNSFSLPSVPLVGNATTVCQTSTGSTLRLHDVDGEIVAERTYRDTEFTGVDTFLQYVDSRNDAWVHSLEGNQGELDTYLSKVKLDATRGNQFYGERQRMKPEAAAEINAYRGTLRLLEHGDGTRAPSAEQQQEILRIRGAIARLLEAPSTWTNAALYTYEVNSAAQTRGFSYIGAVQLVDQVSAQRELSALPARQ
jgi:hypothetical protein